MSATRGETLIPNPNECYSTLTSETRDINLTRRNRYPVQKSIKTFEKVFEKHSEDMKNVVDHKRHSKILRGQKRSLLQWDQRHSTFQVCNFDTSCRTQPPVMTLVPTYKFVGNFFQAFVMYAGLGL